MQTVNETEHHKLLEILDLSRKIQVARRELEESAARNRELLAAVKSVCSSIESLRRRAAGLGLSACTD
jgi:hypothetical protein